MPDECGHFGVIGGELRRLYDPVYLDAVLVTLLDPAHPRVPEDADFGQALWMLRARDLVGWIEDFGCPSDELTPAGRALAERLAGG